MDAPPTKHRFQFSLGTLLLLVITVGAFMGNLTLYWQSEMLRTVVSTQHEQLGTLVIADHKKAYVRVMQTSNPWLHRYNMYLPNDGEYLFKIRSSDSEFVVSKTRPDWQEIEAREQLRAGEFQFDIDFMCQSDYLIMKMNLVSKNSKGVPFERARKYGWGWLDVQNCSPTIVAGPNTSDEIDFSKPVQLLSLKDVSWDCEINVTMEKVR